MPCPHCRSELPALKRPEACPGCGRPLTDDDGRTLRPVDLNFDSIRAELDEKAKLRSVRGGFLALALMIAAQIPLIGALAVPAIFVANMAWGRLAIALPYSGYFSTRRKLITTWVSRLALLTASGLHLSAPVPLAGAILSPLVFVGSCLGVWGYYRMHLGQEFRREPVSPLESLILSLLVILVLALILLAVLAALGVGALVKLFGG